MPPGLDFLPLGMQGRGQRKVERGYLSPDLASVFGMLQFWKRSQTVATPEALFQNTFHLLSNYCARPDQLHGVLLTEIRTALPHEGSELSANHFHNHKIVLMAEGGLWRCKILTENCPKSVQPEENWRQLLETLTQSTETAHRCRT